MLRSKFLPVLVCALLLNAGAVARRPAAAERRPAASALPPVDNPFQDSLAGFKNFHDMLWFSLKTFWEPKQANLRTYENLTVFFPQALA